MELSTNHGPASVHILAYLFDPLNADIISETARIRDGRLRRAERIVERIGADYRLSWDDVLAQSTDGGTIGRPHIADALVMRGHVAKRSAAFESILHWRSGYYEKYYAPSPLEGVRMIVAAGGVPVLAHPATGGRYRMIDEETSGAGGCRSVRTRGRTTATTLRTARSGCSSSPGCSASPSRGQAITTARASRTGWARTRRAPKCWSSSSRGDRFEPAVVGGRDLTDE